MTSSGDQQRLRQMPAEEFVRRLRDFDGVDDTHFAFFLGAGCSVTSGIPAAGSLVADQWLPRLCKVRAGDSEDVDAWAATAFGGYDPENPGAHYGQVMGELFIHPEERQREVERLCDVGKPGFGYAILATLLSHKDGLFNVALTTNFDDLIADATYVFGSARPLVINDAALASYIRPTRMRPLVVKVHGDNRLRPMNTTSETAILEAGISQGIGDLLHDRGVIFIGYGGNDRGIAEFFEDLPPSALPLGIWWASRTEPTGVLRSWLEDRDATWIESPGFDELMLLFKSEFEIGNPDRKKFDDLFDNFLTRYQSLAREVGRRPAPDPSMVSLQAAADREDSNTTDWSGQFFAATRSEEMDPEGAEEIYKSAIAANPEVGFLPMGLAGLLLRRGRNEEAMKWAEKAYELEPENSLVVQVYGLAQACIGHLEEAVATLRAGVARHPRADALRAMLAFHLTLIDDHAEAERELAEISLAEMTAPDDLNLLGVVLTELGRYEEAAKLFEEALDKAGDDGSIRTNFVRTLILLGRRDEVPPEGRVAHESLPPVASTDRLELGFYRLAAGSEAEKAEALSEMKKLLLGGIRLRAWNLSGVVRSVEEMADPDATWISLLAEVVGGRRELGDLDEWERWREA